MNNKNKSLYELRKERIPKEIKEYVDKEFERIDKEWEESHGRN